jgi:16S rRNA U516 pseudouridylate synthase RsuA-like enzyme
MDEDRFNIEVRKFLKEVGVTSQREIERVVREGQVKGTTLRLKMTLTSDDVPALRHAVERSIDVRDD